MQFNKQTMGTLVVLGMASSAMANTIDLTTTIRDFHACLIRTWST